MTDEVTDDELRDDQILSLAVELERVKFRTILDEIKADISRFHDGAFRMGMEQAIEEVEARIDEEWEAGPTPDICAICKKEFNGTFTELKASWCEECDRYVCSLCRAAHNMQVHISTDSSKEAK